MRDSVSFWVFDDRGELGLPRIGIERSRPTGTPTTFRSTSRSRTAGSTGCARTPRAGPSKGPTARPSVLGAGPLAFTCVSPSTLAVSFDGKAVQTTSADLAAGRKDGPLVDVRFDVEAKLAIPPWVQGALQPDAETALKTSIVGDLMGGHRYEQLFRATGSVHVEGREHPFAGTGLRIRRQGVRRLEGFWGHCWQSALFPSGRAFGYIAYPPRPDGEPTFNEGYVYSGDGDLVAARVSRRHGSPGCSHWARTSRWCWRPPTASSGSKGRRCCPPTTSPI